MTEVPYQYYLTVGGPLDARYKIVGPRMSTLLYKTQVRQSWRESSQHRLHTFLTWFLFSSAEMFFSSFCR